MKLYMHHQTVVIYTSYKFYEIPSIGSLFMAEDRKIHWQFEN